MAQRDQLPIPALFKKAFELHQSGDVASAAVLYRQIVGVAPDHANALHLLGVIAHGRGSNDEAIDLIRRAIGVDPSNPRYYNNLGGVLRAEGQLEQAARCYEKALSLRVDYAEAHNNLGNVLDDLGQVDAALASYVRALGLSETAAFKTNFAGCIQNATVHRIDPKIRGLLVRAVSEAWARPADLVKVSTALLKGDRDAGGCIERASVAWPDRLTSEELFGARGLTVVASDPLLLALLQNAQISDPAFERFLTMARHALVVAATSAHTLDDAVDDAVLALYSALARQCFINGYVFSFTEDEIASVDVLRADVIGRLQRDQPIPALWLIALGAYHPLLSIEGVEALVARSWPRPVRALLQQQIAEPIEERGCVDTTRRATPIDGEVSRSVQQQYEEDPYPRWVRLPIAGAALPIESYIRRHFPLVRTQRPGKEGEIDILVAGCGTGQESSEIACQIAQARVLAIDLSLSSLCYAQRKARELGLKNIEYAQADILQLRSLGRTFDLITASGVLHHLADPFAGLCTLVSLLRPGGLMRIGLYSEVGRQAVVAAREFIAQRGYVANASDIRRCRLELMSAGDPRFHPLTASRDFYAMAECRDLLFHVQEHRFTLPQIREMLAALGLEFLGFSLRSHVTRSYAQRYPNDKTQTDLDHWHAFETEFPMTFAGMYQFLVRKPGAA